MCVCVYVLLHALSGYSEKLDELLILRDNGQKLLASLPQRYREETGMS